MLSSTWFFEYLGTFSSAVNAGEIIQGLSLPLSRGVEALSSNISCSQLSEILTKKLLLKNTVSY